MMESVRRNVAISLLGFAIVVGTILLTRWDGARHDQMIEARLDSATVVRATMTALARRQVADTDSILHVLVHEHAQDRELLRKLAQPIRAQVRETNARLDTVQSVLPKPKPHKGGSR